ncbi:hypothetical protein DL98DRAFT_541406 [Cadophora sp. DSE1049]|nr:hypothetical protein DL98DRAFT_541406 [Cadophora sp. DSE1049]
MDWFLPDKLVCHGTVNCTVTDNGVIGGDPDIVVIGVIVAFIAASFITFISIIVGYATYSIDEEQLNYVDSLVIPNIRWLLHMGAGDTISDETRRLRSATMTQFILALSDQQVVTGLAVLITGYAQRCSISGHHFQLIANLAWFSSTTHLSTIAVLQQYLIRHPVIKYIRVIGIFAVLGLLFHAQLHVQWAIFPFIPIQCTFASRTIEFGSEVLVVSSYDYISWVAVVLFLFVAYAIRLIRLYASPPATSIRTLMEDQVLRRLDLPPLKTPEQLLLSTLKSLQDNEQTTSQQHRWPTHPIRRAHTLYLLNMFMDFFLWQIIWMLFGNSFGLLQLCRTRFGPPLSIDDFDVQIRGSENTWGFGQLVALLLMILALLAAVEAYYALKTSIATGQSPPIIDQISQSDATASTTLFHSSGTRVNIIPCLEVQEYLATYDVTNIRVVWAAFFIVWALLGPFIYFAGWQNVSSTIALVGAVAIIFGVGLLTIFYLYPNSEEIVRDILAQRRARHRLRTVTITEELHLRTLRGGTAG